MNICANIRESFSGYLDGAISGREMQAVAAHLEACEPCTEEFAAWRGMQRMLASVGPVKVPAALGENLRQAIAQENARPRTWWNPLRWENLLPPTLLRVTAGFAGAILLIGSIVMLLGPEPVLANDELLGTMSAPHLLYSVSQQPMMTSADTTLVIQARISSEGRVYDYNIVSGPTDQATEAQVREQLMLQVYEPARVFGEPVRGQVLITFSGVSVRG